MIIFKAWQLIGGDIPDNATAITTSFHPPFYVTKTLRRADSDGSIRLIIRGPVFYRIALGDKKWHASPIDKLRLHSERSRHCFYKSRDHIRGSAGKLFLDYILMVFTLRLSPNYGRFRDYVISQSYNQGPLSHVTHSEINSSIWGVFEQWLKVVSYVYANGSCEFVSNSVSCVSV